MGATWNRRLGQSLPLILPGRAEQTATCRLLSNDAVTMEHVLVSQSAQAVERCRAERLVVAERDTTTLDRDGLAKTSGFPAQFGVGWMRRTRTFVWMPTRLAFAGRPGTGARRSRRCAPVEMLAPRDRKDEPPIRMIAVSELEDPPPLPSRWALKSKEKNTALCRMLLTSEGRADLDTA